jgi:NADH-quinone oxidoreductase subunit C
MDVQTAVAKVSERFPDGVVETSTAHGEATVIVNRDALKDVLGFLKTDADFVCDFLSFVTAVDRHPKVPRFEVVYEVYSIELKHRVRIKTRITEEDAKVPSVVDIYRGANWHERETYDLFGVVFEGHPNLRRIVLPTNWDGHPLRKEYSAQGQIVWSLGKNVLPDYDREAEETTI